MSVANIILGAVGKTFQAASDMLADQKVTVGEVWVSAMGISQTIVDLVPGAGEKVVYTLDDGTTLTVSELISAIQKTGTAALIGFKVFEYEIGEVK